MYKFTGKLLYFFNQFDKPSKSGATSASKIVIFGVKGRFVCVCEF